MATVTKRTHNGAISYQAKIRLTGYPPMSATFERKTDAQKWAQIKEAEIRQGKFFPHEIGQKRTVSCLS